MWRQAFQYEKKMAHVEMKKKKERRKQSWWILSMHLEFYEANQIILMMSNLKNVHTLLLLRTLAVVDLLLTLVFHWKAMLHADCYNSTNVSLFIRNQIEFGLLILIQPNSWWSCRSPSQLLTNALYRYIYLLKVLSKEKNENFTHLNDFSAFIRMIRA